MTRTATGHAALAAMCAPICAIHCCVPQRADLGQRKLQLRVADKREGFDTGCGRENSPWHGNQRSNHFGASFRTLMFACKVA
jgi:hypothetical protein